MNRKLYIFYKTDMNHLTQKIVKTVVTTIYLGGKNVDITKETFISHPEYAKLQESVLTQVNDIIPDLVYWVNYVCMDANQDAQIGIVMKIRVRGKMHVNPWEQPLNDFVYQIVV